jgi:rod shape-determining protein MreC
VFAVVLGLLLLLMSRADPAKGGALREAAMDATAPIWALARTPFTALGRAGDYIGDYFGAVDRNRHLEAELRRYRVRDQERIALVRQNRQLKQLLGVIEPKRGWHRVLPIAAASSGSYVRSAVVSGGRSAGLRVGQPVRSMQGLVGRVVEVGGSAARVMLLTDASSRVPVRIVRTGRPAMVAGINGADLEVRFVAPADGQLRIGDRLVTSGDGGIFPPDVPVAVVTQVRGDVLLARPLAHPEALGYVLVETPYMPTTSLAPAAGPAAP